MSNLNPIIPKPGPGRPRGKGNAQPTRDELRDCQRQLRAAAAEGNVNAAGWLLTINVLEQQIKARGQANGK